MTSVGFVWLCRVPKRDYLTVYQTVENTTPLTLAGGLQPVLGIDLWEHAFWIKHPNRRYAKKYSKKPPQNKNASYGTVLNEIHVKNYIKKVFFFHLFHKKRSFLTVC